MDGWLQFNFSSQLSHSWSKKVAWGTNYISGIRRHSHQTVLPFYWLYIDWHLWHMMQIRVHYYNLQCRPKSDGVCMSPAPPYTRRVGDDVGENSNEEKAERILFLSFICFSPIVTINHNDAEDLDQFWSTSCNCRTSDHKSNLFGLNLLKRLYYFVRLYLDSLARHSSPRWTTD